MSENVAYSITEQPSPDGLDAENTLNIVSGQELVPFRIPRELWRARKNTDIVQGQIQLSQREVVGLIHCLVLTRARFRAGCRQLERCEQGVVRLVFCHNVNVLDNLTYLIGAGHAVCFHVVQSKRSRRGNRGGVGDYTGLYVVIR